MPGNVRACTLGRGIHSCWLHAAPCIQICACVCGQYPGDARGQRSPALVCVKITLMSFLETSNYWVRRSFTVKYQCVVWKRNLGMNLVRIPGCCVNKFYVRSTSTRAISTYNRMHAVKHELQLCYRQPSKCVQVATVAYTLVRVTRTKIFIRFLIY